MKLTALKCPSCGGPIELDEKDENVGYCQYCHTKYYLESEQPKVFIEYKQETSHNSMAMKEESGSKAAIAVGAVIGVIGIMALILIPLSGTSKNANKYPSREVTVAASVSEEQSSDKSRASATYSASFEVLIKEALATSVSSVTEEELGRFKYLSMRKGEAGWMITYSFENPIVAAEQGQDADINVVVCQEALELQDIAALPQLEYLNLDHTELPEGSLETLSSLKMITCDYIQLDMLRLALGDAAKGLERLNASHLKSLEELSYFPGLKSLEMEDCREISDISALAQVKDLENLKLYDMDEVNDFTVLNVLKKLRSLSIDAENLKDISFINHMPELASLGITDSKILLLDPLVGKESLKELVLVDNGEVRDYNPVGTLTGLETLVINKYTSQDDPDLTALTGLKHGEFHGMMGIRFLGSLTGLEELKVQGCNVDQPSVIASLPALKKLTYRKNWGNSDDLSFLAGCQGLTCLDMNHSEFYGDVSYAFNLPALETLILDSSSFEVKFDRLQDNPALKALSLNRVKLYKNIEMWSDGMVRSINYDDVLLDEYTSFLGHYPSLEYLSLRGNQLTDLQFAAGLKNLRELDVTDNYVTDTHVLDQLEYLGKDSTVKRPMADVDWIDTVEDSH
ncbi:leucine-rich repeat domain-containing protein [Hungatella sp.]|uniref:leucine-rich repeat domain-containing protein n=1 Tax=Hungatella sp. TaxID=2613924 RepID=UPI002A807217|nr:leucine-rich repeat domain-containing protein [Hungatella sp.]